MLRTNSQIESLQRSGFAPVLCTASLVFVCICIPGSNFSEGLACWLPVVLFLGGRLTVPVCLAGSQMNLRESGDLRSQGQFPPALNVCYN